MKTGVKTGPAPRLATPPALPAIAGRLADEMAGTGPLATLLADPSVTDVLVNGGEIWVDRGEGGLRRVAGSMGDEAYVRKLAQRLASNAGRRLDDASPFVDVRLPDGTRMHAVLPPVALRGPYLSLRTFRRRAFTLDELERCGTLDPGAAGLLRAVVAARLPYLVTGGTGTGKTTVLASLLSIVPFGERVVIVEDAAELRPAHPHVVALQARVANVEGAGQVTLRDLVRQALRMRPDRLIVGECRGAEIIDLLGALNTGHEGGAATLHANSPADVPARLEALGLLGGVPRAALHAMVVSALRIVVHLHRTATGRRELTEICVLARHPDRHTAVVITAWRRGSGPGPGAADLAEMLAARGVEPPKAEGRWKYTPEDGWS
ncbi:TadA family conjugal transfer-associated ATPase [Dactylosporangium sp. CA-052675]|uniref:TadA family conjugal transfer-associated ATPase n=1 Tax=Dactylosporangium sp. CA-052675 TaxID=3239927 RepID=UPI003D93991E